MTKGKIQSLIDRVIGKGGILRVPAYWMHRILNKLMEHSEDAAATSASKALADAKTYADAAIEEAAKEYGVTGDELKYYTLPAGVSQALSIRGEATVDTYKFSDSEAEEWRQYLKSPDDKVVRILLSDGIYVNATFSDPLGKYSSSSGGGIPVFRFEWMELTSIVNGEGNLVYHWATIEVRTDSSSKAVESQVLDWAWKLPLQVDSSMLSNSINPVQNKVVKAYIDKAVSDLEAQFTNNMTSNEEVTSAALNELRDKIVHLEEKLNALNQ